ncbi:hypothetical protein LIA77_07826 [Sarocladium implicatum]|nr:hypothetical protein LIA77_07826 [Sarocladium implicatum]
MDWIENYVNAYFIAEGQRVGLTGISGSRRVVLYEIPSTISLATVLEAVAAPDDPKAGIPGGIISAQIFKDLGREARAKKHQCALIEFAHPLAAQRFVKHLQENEVHFNATNTWRYPRLHRARARLASTQSTSLRPDTIYQLLAKQTRALVVPTCPPEIVWEILATIGTQVFTKVEYLWQDSALLLEFVSMFEADRAYGLLCSDSYPQFAICKLDPPRFKPDSTQRGFESISNQYVQSSGLSLDAEFKQEPFTLSCGQQPTTWVPFYCLSLVHRLCLRNNILPHELPEWLTEREALAGQDVEIIGTEFNMTRTSFGWAIDPDSRMKLLLASNLHDPQFAKAWDDYFRLRKLPNLRRYEAYEEARRREAKNAELGPILIPDIETTDHVTRDGPELQNLPFASPTGPSTAECVQAQGDGDTEDLISFEQGDGSTEDLMSFEQGDDDPEDLISFEQGDDDLEDLISF